MRLRLLRDSPSVFASVGRTGGPALDPIADRQLPGSSAPKLTLSLASTLCEVISRMTRGSPTAPYGWAVSRCLELEEFDKVACRVLDQDSSTGATFAQAAPELRAGAPQADDEVIQLFRHDHDAIPAAWLRLAARLPDFDPELGALALSGHIFYRRFLSPTPFPKSRVADSVDSVLSA